VDRKGIQKVWENPQLLKRTERRKGNDKEGGETTPETQGLNDRGRRGWAQGWPSTQTIFRIKGGRDLALMYIRRDTKWGPAIGGLTKVNHDI